MRVSISGRGECWHIIYTSILRSWDQAWTRQAINVWTHICTLRKEARDASKISWWKYEERLHTKIRITHRIPDSLCTEKRWIIMIMCWLSQT